MFLSFQILQQDNSRSLSAIQWQLIFEMELIKYKEQVIFEQGIDVKDPKIPIKGSMTFQTCDATKCLPPKTLAFEINAQDGSIKMEGDEGGTGFLMPGEGGQ